MGEVAIKVFQRPKSNQLVKRSSMHHDENNRCYDNRRVSGLTIILLVLTIVGLSLIMSPARTLQANAPAKDQSPAADLTGNWVVRTPNADGTFRLTYFNLNQEGPR